MKICITTNSIDDKMADKRFARSMYLGVYDTESKSIEYIENEGFKSNHGAGIAAAHQVIKLGVDAILTGNVGPNAYEILEDAEIKVYKLMDLDIDNAIAAFGKEELTQIETAAPKHFGMGK